MAGGACDHGFIPAGDAFMIHPFFVSAGIVALAEMGDKTQLLALLLTTQFRKPVPIILGILISTLINHAFAGAVGSWVATLLGPDILRWVLGISFLGMAAWTLIPDKLDDDNSAGRQLGVFATTVVAFFLAEMGDKTQIATVALAAQYQSLFWVVAGTTVGMMLANVPVVLFGDWLTKRIPVRKIHITCAIIFAVMGILVLLGVGDLI
jgi:putative Ca2+/H+ antiporter (TMEM165/GDT1 family)